MSFSLFYSFTAWVTDDIYCQSQDSLILCSSLVSTRIFLDWVMLIGLHRLKMKVKTKTNQQQQEDSWVFQKVSEIYSTRSVVRHTLNHGHRESTAAQSSMRAFSQIPTRKAIRSLYNHSWFHMRSTHLLSEDAVAVAVISKRKTYSLFTKSMAACVQI